MRTVHENDGAAGRLSREIRSPTTAVARRWLPPCLWTRACRPRLSETVRRRQILQGSFPRRESVASVGTDRLEANGSSEHRSGPRSSRPSPSSRQGGPPAPGWELRLRSVTSRDGFAGCLVGDATGTHPVEAARPKAATVEQCSFFKTRCAVRGRDGVMTRNAPRPHAGVPSGSERGTESFSPRTGRVCAEGVWPARRVKRPA
jgi:hypothetical protein